MQRIRKAIRRWLCNHTKGVTVISVAKNPTEEWRDVGFDSVNHCADGYIKTRCKHCGQLRIVKTIVTRNKFSGEIRW